MRTFYNITRGLRAVADLFLPRVCVVCGRRLLLNERIICLYCQADIPLTHFWKMKSNAMADRFNAVIQVGLEKAWEEEDGDYLGISDEGRDYGKRSEGSYDDSMRPDRFCNMLMRRPLNSYERYAFAAALFFYSHEVDFRHILYNLKYEGRTDVGKYFGHQLGVKLGSSAIFMDVDCVMPVPLHWTRKWRRGYNQAEVIAREVADALGARLRCNILVRRRRTRTQTKLDIKGKAINVEGAFTVQLSHEHLQDIKHILLIDDVFTTGATLHACFVALRTIFPPSVRISVATLAFVGGV